MLRLMLLCNKLSTTQQLEPCFKLRNIFIFGIAYQPRVRCKTLAQALRTMHRSNASFFLTCIVTKDSFAVKVGFWRIYENQVDFVKITCDLFTYSKAPRLRADFPILGSNFSCKSSTMITFAQGGAAEIKSKQFSEFGSRTIFITVLRGKNEIQ